MRIANADYTCWQFTSTTSTASTNNSGYGSLNDCNTGISTLKNTALVAPTTTACQSYTSTTQCTSMAAAIKATDPVNVNTIAIPADETKYKMLVPLPGVTCMDSTGKDTTCMSNDIGAYLNLIFKMGIGICVALAVIMLIINGITYMGDESVFGKTEAKNKMFMAIMGLLIVIGAWVLLNTINPALTGAGGVAITPADLSLSFNPTSGGGYFGVVAGTPGVPNADKNITTYDTFLQTAASHYGLSCTLIKSFMYAESGGVNNLTSPSGAQGLIQLIPTTFAAQNVGTDPMDPQTNINAAASYLSKLLTTGCNNSSTSTTCDVTNIPANTTNILYLAAAYNGGPGANKDSAKCSGMTIWQCPQTVCNNGTDCFAETRAYAPKVQANFNALTANGWGC